MSFLQEEDFFIDARDVDQRTPLHHACDNGNMEVAMAAVRDQPNAICEAGICYTGNILDSKRDKSTAGIRDCRASILVSSSSPMEPCFTRM